MKPAAAFPPRLDELVFDEATHRYFFGGRQLPNVTRVLEVVFPWQDSEAGRRARERGTEVHLVCQVDDERQLHEPSVRGEIRPYLEAWRAFRRRTGFVPEPDGIEIRRHHPGLGYAGTIDRVGYLHDGRHVVVDIKTGGRYPQHRLQLAAYANLLPNPLDYHRATVTLKSDGSFVFDEYPYNEFAADIAVFRSILNIYNFLKNHKLLRGE